VQGLRAGGAFHSSSGPHPLTKINWELWGPIIGGVVGLLLLLCVIYCVRNRRSCRETVYIEPYLALALARVHNADPEKRAREFARIGVGSHPDSINEWVDEMWRTLNLDSQAQCSPKDFEVYVRGIMKQANINKKFVHWDVLDLFERIDFTDN